MTFFRVKHFDFKDFSSSTFFSYNDKKISYIIFLKAKTRYTCIMTIKSWLNVVQLKVQVAGWRISKIFYLWYFSTSPKPWILSPLRSVHWECRASSFCWRRLCWGRPRSRRWSRSCPCPPSSRRRGWWQPPSRSCSLFPST